jgi:nucleoside-diphosphate-sugar epimerase
VPPLEGQSVLLTGAAGFIGSHLARRLLAAGALVHVFLRPQGDHARIAGLLPRLTVHAGDLRNDWQIRRAWEKCRPDLIVNAAVQRTRGTTGERRQAFQVGLASTLALLECAAEFSCRHFLHLGSSTEYGSAPDAMREDQGPDPVCFHGAVKAASTILCRTFARMQNLPVTVLRLFHVYGPGETPNRLIPTVVRAAFDGQELLLTKPGYCRDYVFIDDVVAACLACLGRDLPPGEIINIGSGRQTANEQIVRTIQAVTGRRIRVRVGVHPARPWDKKSWQADIDRARHLLDWQPEYSLERGIARTVAAVRQSRAA